VEQEDPTGDTKTELIQLLAAVKKNLYFPEQFVGVRELGSELYWG
jgi:hypothetical protein